MISGSTYRPPVINYDEGAFRRRCRADSAVNNR
jgi:hypothetical protein